jgi:exodeoxyribonuclease X
MEEMKVRVIDLETAGNGPNDVCEIGWQDVMLEQDGRWRLNDERGALFVNPGRAISAEAMAVHHILDFQVAEAPLWKQIAASILQPARRQTR